jgi:stage II sporulation protein AA (anti-sigma F factor antagonist)
MELQTDTQGHVSIVRVNGTLDTRASSEFERRVLELFNAGARYFVFNFGGVTLLTSAGIRVLMMLAKRLGGIDKIVVCSPNDQVSVVFRISGLTGHLKTTETEPEAIAHLSPANAPKPAKGAEQSKLARLAILLLSHGGETSAAPLSESPATAGEVSKLAAHLAEVLIIRQSSPTGVSSETGGATPRH